MRIRTRIILGFAILFSLGFYFVGDFMVRDIRPRYLEAVEESLNDTVNILASLIESELREGSMDLSLLRKTFDAALKKKLDARIYGFRKTGVELSVYVTDRRGIVIYDSNGGLNEGKDFSHWNDVYLTLKGEYGARSTRLDEEDPSSSLIHVAAPVRSGGKIIGSVTVVKPHDSVTVFMQLARSRIFLTGFIAVVAFLVLSFIISAWISRPVMKLTDYINSLREKKHPVFPELSGLEIRNLGEAFRELLEELEGKKYIEDYIQSLTHELKSPLSSIRGAAELLMEENMEKVHLDRFCGNILTESRRIDTIIEKMLLIASLERRDRLENMEDIDLHGLVEEVLESLSPQIALKKIQIENRMDKKLILPGEKFLLRHTVSNLLQNGINFSPENGSIILSSEAAGENVVLKITDNGSGIPEYAEEKIFNRFYSLPREGSGRKGTGLGLTFVREAVNLHGGEISVRNNSHGGVTSRLTIPLKNI
jgi:two-component system sensor histidine kinase CreC